MQKHIYTVEELTLDESFVSWCLHDDVKNSSHWQTIVEENKSEAEVFSEAKALIKLLHGGLSKNEVNRQIEKVRLQVQERKKLQVENETASVQGIVLSSNFTVTKDGRIKRNFFRVLTVSAAAACLFFLMIWRFSGIKNSDDSIAKEFKPGMTFQSALGQRRNVTLPDGSEIVLNSKSNITLEANFNQSSRHVKLTGDAFFKIAKNASKPFVVFANEIHVVALGTEFYVHGNYNNNKEVKIDLLEGKVKVETNDKEGVQKKLILLPGESTETDDGINLHKIIFDKTYLRHWVHGNLSFDDIPITEAFEKLQSWYDVEIKVDKEGLKNYKVSGEYNNASVQDILKVICFSINKKFIISGNTFVIQ